MVEVLNFVVQSFWHFFGTFLLVGMICGGIANIGHKEVKECNRCKNCINYKKGLLK